MFSFLAPPPGPPEAQTEEASAGVVGLGSIWSIANAVTSAVQQTAEEVVKTVKETDWKSEIVEFSREVQVDAQTVGVSTATAVQHLPEQVNGLLERGAEGEDHQPLPSVEQLLDPDQVGKALGDVGTSISSWGQQFIRGARDMLDEVKEVVQEEVNALQQDNKRQLRERTKTERRLASMTNKYSRFEAEVAAMQRDSSTYIDEPPDADDFAAWSSTFDLDAAQGEVERITGSNAFMAELQTRLVPLLVERQDFWCRYFYRLYKLQQKETARQQLAQRTQQLNQEEQGWSWDDDQQEGAAGGEEAGAGPAAGASGAAAAAAGAGAGAAAAAGAAAGEGEGGVGKEEQGGGGASPAHQEQGGGAGELDEHQQQEAAAEAARSPSAAAGASTGVCGGEGSRGADGNSAGQGAAAAVAAVAAVAGVSGDAAAGAEGVPGAAAEHGSEDAGASVGDGEQQQSVAAGKLGEAGDAAAGGRQAGAGAAEGAEEPAAAPAAAAATAAGRGGGSGGGAADDCGSAHAETASSGSGQGDWLVVTEGQPKPSCSQLPVPDAPAAAAAPAQGQARPADAAAEAAAGDAPGGRGDSSSQPAGAAGAAASAAAAADDAEFDDSDDFAAGAPVPAEGEEVDEDWGTWD